MTNEAEHEPCSREEHVLEADLTECSNNISSSFIGKCITFTHENEMIAMISMRRLNEIRNIERY